MSNLELWHKVEKTDPKHVKEITGSILARLERHISPEPNSGCWLWVGSVSRNGYGRINVRLQTGKHAPRSAHRIAYELLCKPIPAGLDLDHLCRTRCCVNPSHLEPVTRSENLRRGAGATVARLRTAEIRECPQGHPLSGENLYLSREGKRACRICRSAASQRHKNKRLSR